MLKPLIFCLTIAAVLALLVKINQKMDGEPFRKLLHTIAYSCPVLIIHFSSTWQTASMTLAVIAIIVYPLLALVEKHPYYAKFFFERRDGEVKLSMLQLFLGTAFISAVCWGIFNMKHLAGCAILMWGPGDAAAALLGKRYGRHKINLPLADHHKSWEGSISFMVCAIIAGTIWLSIFSDMSLLSIMITTLITAMAGAYTELVTKGGFDTITVPTANMVVLIALSNIII